MLCQKCGANIPDTDMYCPSCGALRPAPPPGRKACAHCKSYIPAGAKTCPVCRKSQGLSFSGIIGAIIFLIALPFIVSAVKNIMIGYNSAAKGPELGKTVTMSQSAEVITPEIQALLDNIETTAQNTLGSDIKVEYCAETNTYILSHWREGFCAIVVTGDRTQEWNDMILASTVVSATLSDYVHEYDPTANMCFNILNEYNSRKALVMTMNGKVIYDVLE